MLYTALIASTIFSVLSFTFNFYQIITELSSYLILSICSLIAVYCLYGLYKDQEENYIFINNDEIWFQEKLQNETICLKFNKLNYFETRFSEIVFSTKEEEKVTLQLDRISDEKKRWEIKEFLRNHVTQIRDQKVSLLETA